MSMRKMSVTVVRVFPVKSHSSGVSGRAACSRANYHVSLYKLGIPRFSQRDRPINAGSRLAARGRVTLAWDLS